MKDKNYENSHGPSKRVPLSQLMFIITISYHNNPQIKSQQQIKQTMRDNQKN